MMELSKQVGTQSFKTLIAAEPRVMLADSAPKDVVDLLELEIAKCRDDSRLLRLMCLVSLTNNGVPKDACALLRKEFVDAFGVSELLRLLNLERAGLLKKKESGKNLWYTLRTVMVME